MATRRVVALQYVNSVTMESRVVLATEDPWMVLEVMKLLRQHPDKCMGGRPEEVFGVDVEGRA